jgi:hypothetical protein
VAGELGRAPDARRPQGPGGWNRIHLIVDDIAAEVERLRSAGLSFRSELAGCARQHPVSVPDAGLHHKRGRAAHRTILMADARLLQRRDRDDVRTLISAS